ncbi:hypothetical protein BH11PSE3_BH11PSE3_50020 [soil metagenome]
MPLYWTIDSRARLFSCVGEGEVGFADAVSLLEAMAGAGALSYRKLFDGTAATASLTPDEIMSLCVQIRTLHGAGAMGALAMVGTPEQTMVFARLLGVLASAERPIKVFNSSSPAQDWIEKQGDALPM